MLRGGVSQTAGKCTLGEMDVREREEGKTREILGST